MSNDLVIHHVDEHVTRVCKAAFPRYIGRKFKLVVRGEKPNDKGLVPVRLDMETSGGTYNSYVFIRLSDCKALPFAQQPGYGNVSQDAFITRDVAMVNHAFFCGRDMGLTLTIHPQAATGLLPPPTTLSNDEITVLHCSSAYISRYRLQESGLERQAWNEAKSSLHGKKLLTKSGAITMQGRDALEQYDVRRKQTP